MSIEIKPWCWLVNLGDCKLYVSPKCPKCAQFIKVGLVERYLFDDRLVFRGWVCGRCGEVTPDYEWE